MNRKLEVKYRTWYKGVPPRPIKLQIPGWSGEKGHSDGDQPQPWHCPPFVEGATYGLELIYPFDMECRIKMNNDQIQFEGDFSKEEKECGVKMPFMNFAPHHFGFTSSLDIKPPPGYIIRLEPHPRFYTDTTDTVPCCVAGHLQSEWWPKFFFVVFKSPRPGQTLIFRKGEPYGQILILPSKVEYSIEEMTPEEKFERHARDGKINKYGKEISQHSWKDHKDQHFNDKYKILKRIFSNEGEVDSFLNKITDKQNKLKASARKMLRRVIRPKNETDKK